MNTIQIINQSTATQKLTADVKLVHRINGDSSFAHIAVTQVRVELRPLREHVSSHSQR